MNILSKNITNIYAKAALNKEQLDGKIKIGCDGIELQLLSEFINGKVGNYHNVEDVVNLEEYKNYDIRVVHAPILSVYGLSDITLEDFVDDDITFLEQVFKVADYFGSLHSRRTLIVIHSETTVGLMSAIGDTWGRVVKYLGYLLYKYPYTEVGIENVPPLRNALADKIELCNNFKFDNVDMALKLREELKTDRVGTVLDICHAKISDMYLNHIRLLIPEAKPEDYSLNAYFSANSGVIKLIHLADFAGCGYGKGQHGTKITEENKSTMEEVIELYNKYHYCCPITLEVEESDFISSPNYRDTKELIDRCRV